MEIGDTTALGEMLGIAMREDVGIVAGTVYDDRDRLYCAGLEFAGAYESRFRNGRRKQNVRLI